MNDRAKYQWTFTLFTALFPDLTTEQRAHVLENPPVLPLARTRYHGPVLAIGLDGGCVLQAATTTEPYVIHDLARAATLGDAQRAVADPVVFCYDAYGDFTTESPE